MQRLLTLVFLLCLAVPAGISISGCTRNPAGNYCNGEGFGLKITSVASIDLEPRTTGISLAFGQTQQLASPSAKTCKGTAASVASYTFGTTNNQLVDISPSGNMCAGNWNRRSGGGIPDYTTCLIPAALPTTNNLPYSTAYVTATAEGVTSNQVQIFVHAQVTAVSLVLEQLNNPTSVITGCLSQTQTAQLDSQAFYTTTVNGTPQQVLLCAPNSTTVPSCSVALGNLAYTAQNTSIATIDQFGVITATQPGTTYITASVAQGASSAGYFSTCPPASIQVTLNGATSGTVTQGVTQNLTTTVLDTNGNTIQGLTLNYQSTNPLDISAGSSGAVTANFAGEAAIYAVCQPTTCNPAPIDKIGVNLTGVPVTSNPVTITTPGLASDYVWMSSPVSPADPGLLPLPGYTPSAGSQYFVPVELISGTVGSPVKMPYFPNSMVLDKTGTNLYFGSNHELMIYSAATNALSKEDPNVPGVVLAASPTNGTILINDPIRRLFYVYTPSSGSFSTYSGVGTSAQWTPDAQTLYIVGTSYATNPAGAPTLFVDNVNTGWTTYPLTQEGQSPDPASVPLAPNHPATNLAITVPSVGAFLSGNPTVANAWCPKVTTASAGTNTLVQAYPQAATVNAQTDILGATTDGAHILGVGLDGGTTPTLTDVNPNLFAGLKTGACPSNTAGTAVLPLALNTPFVQTPLSFQASAINQVVPSPASNLAFVTYSPTPGSTATATLPYYEPTSTGSLGTVGQVALTGTPTVYPTAPLTGVFSLDDTLFFVSTSGDDLVHYINVQTLKDTQQISPGLVDVNGNALPATAIAAKPRPTT
jgi:trimeric autotransporter adhesin